MARIAVGDIELSWHERGSGDRPLLLVHGFTGSSDDWADELDDLALIGRTVVVDQRGHGESENPGGGYTFDALAEELVAFMDATGIAPCDVLGHSMGGAVLLRAALSHPDRFTSLILMDTTGRPMPLVGDWFEKVAANARANGMGAVAAAAEAYPLTGEEADIAAIQGEAAHRARARTKLEQMDVEAFASIPPQFDTTAGVEDRLGEIGVPTTVIVGADDLPFVTSCQALATGIPGATLVTIAGAGHSPQKSQPAAWLAAVTEHLVRARAGAGVG